MYHITIDRMDHVSDLADVLATATVSVNACRYSVRMEWLNSLDVFESVSDETFAAMQAYVESAIAERAAQVESMLAATPDKPEDDDSSNWTDSALCVILHGARAITEMESV